MSRHSESISVAALGDEFLASLRRGDASAHQATQLGATITTNTGSQINALGNPGANSFSNSYVAFVARQTDDAVAQRRWLQVALAHSH